MNKWLYLSFGLIALSAFASCSDETSDSSGSGGNTSGLGVGQTCDTDNVPGHDD